MAWFDEYFNIFQPPPQPAPPPPQQMNGLGHGFGGRLRNYLSRAAQGRALRESMGRGRSLTPFVNFDRPRPMQPMQPWVTAPPAPAFPSVQRVPTDRASSVDYANNKNEALMPVRRAAPAWGDRFPRVANQRSQY